jgi:hypothetical protein
LLTGLNPASDVPRAPKPARSQRIYGSRSHRRSCTGCPARTRSHTRTPARELPDASMCGTPCAVRRITTRSPAASVDAAFPTEAEPARPPSPIATTRAAVRRRRRPRRHRNMDSRAPGHDRGSPRADTTPARGAQPRSECAVRHSRERSAHNAEKRSETSRLGAAAGVRTTCSTNPSSVRVSLKRISGRAVVEPAPTRRNSSQTVLIADASVPPPALGASRAGDRRDAARSPTGLGSAWNRRGASPSAAEVWSVGIPAACFKGGDPGRRERLGPETCPCWEMRSDYRKRH